MLTDPCHIGIHYHVDEICVKAGARLSTTIFLHPAEQHTKAFCSWCAMPDVALVAKLTTYR